MTLTTRLCEQLGMTVPIVQAPIGPAASPELVAAVANAGGLGVSAATWFPAEHLRQRIAATRSLTDRPFAVNLGLSFPIRPQLDVCLELGVPIVSTFWGDPADVHAAIAEGGAVHLHTVASAEEARAAVDAGVDVVVAQGWEAGGHVWGGMATLPLVPAVVDAVDPVPVIAAGGIADGRGLAAVLALGAQAAWIGTRFLTATEAGTHEHYRQRVVAASGADTAHTLCFDGGWPDAPHRVLRNGTLDAWESAGRPAAPGRPGEADVIATGPGQLTWHRYDDAQPLAGMTGDVEEMALYAGQSVGLVRDMKPAAEIIASLLAQAEQALTAAQASPSAGI